MQPQTKEDNAKRPPTRHTEKESSSEDKAERVIEEVFEDNED